jgi:Mg2+ and Co2+ transporter CorA
MQAYITDLDGEIEELHQYVSLKEDQSRNKKAAFLNNIATILLPVSVITGFWGMNKWEDVVDSPLFINQCILILIGLIIAICIIYNRRKKL